MKSVMRRPKPMNVAFGGRRFWKTSSFPICDLSATCEDGIEKTPKQRLFSKKARITSSGRGVAQYMSFVANAALTSLTEITDGFVVMRYLSRVHVRCLREAIEDAILKCWCLLERRFNCGLTTTWKCTVRRPSLLRSTKAVVLKSGAGACAFISTRCESTSSHLPGVVHFRLGCASSHSS